MLISIDPEWDLYMLLCLGRIDGVKCYISQQNTKSSSSKIAYLFQAESRDFALFIILHIIFFVIVFPHQEQWTDSCHQGK